MVGVRILGVLVLLVGLILALVCYPFVQAVFRVETTNLLESLFKCFFFLVITIAPLALICFGLKWIIQPQKVEKPRKKYEAFGPSVQQLEAAAKLGIGVPEGTDYYQLKAMLAEAVRERVASEEG